MTCNWAVISESLCYAMVYNESVFDITIGLSCDWFSFLDLVRFTRHDTTVQGAAKNDPTPKM